MDNKLFKKLNAWVTENTGIYFPATRKRELERVILKTSVELGFDCPGSFAEMLLTSLFNNKQIEIFINNLTVGETYFFREKRSLEVFENILIPKIIQARQNGSRHIKIWSAACATGEEPYSIAILLSRIAKLKGWKISIFATDMNSDSLQKASKGVYREWSFRETDNLMRDLYFTKRDSGVFEIYNSVKDMVSFGKINLVKPNFPMWIKNNAEITNSFFDIDIVFCRNVLIYFDSKQINKAINKIYSLLVDDGWLIVSPTEVSHVSHPKFDYITFPGISFFQKNSLKNSENGDFRIGDFESNIKEQLLEDNNARIETLTLVNAKIIEDHNLHPDSQQIQLLKIQNSVVTSDLLNISDSPVEETKNKTPISQQFKEAERLYELGFYDETINKLENIISQEPNHSKAMVILVKIYGNQGKLNDALQWVEKAIAIDKMNPGYYYLHANILQENGQITDAIKSLERALYLDQDFILANFMMGNISLQQGKKSKSEKYLKNTLKLLSNYETNEIIPYSDDGMTYSSLIEIVNSMTEKIEFSE